MTGTDHTPKQSKGLGGKAVPLFLVSLIALFLELLLIRWISTEINIFAYLQNTVLVVCFMGLGMGCLTCQQPIVLRNALVPLLVIVLLLTIPVTKKFLGLIGLFLSTMGDFVVWRMLGTPDRAIEIALAVTAGLLATFALMLLIWEIFVPIGRLLGRMMDQHPNPIVAYSVNIAGSLAGIWLFVLLSIAYQPPGTWFLVAAALLFLLVKPPGEHWQSNTVLLIAVMGLSWFAGRDPGAIEITWSPYQKLVLIQADPTRFEFGKYFVRVNNSLYQWIVDSGASKAAKTEIGDPLHYNQYNLPFILYPKPLSALIVGAGTGNDVAAAVRAGVKRVTAVEIDPAIIDFGRRYHPQKPYASPNVKVVTDDARSFFAASDQRYDVITFGLLDSHTMTAMTNARLDHYVYTKESIQRAKSLLNEGGIVTLTFEVQKPFIGDRIARSLREVFGQEPLVFRIPASAHGVGGVMFVAGDLQAVRKQIALNGALASIIATWQNRYPVNLSGSTEITTDDWPYLYLRERQIPILFYLLALMILTLFMYTRWRLKLTGPVALWEPSYWHFFFLGTSFLLLEVQNISKAAVVLGNTWWVNAVIISGILVMILLANFLAAKVPGIPLWTVYCALIVSCFALYFIDLAHFAFLPYYEKIGIIGGLTALPILFSGLVFIRSFASTGAKDVALGANLIGGVVGGVLQSVTFLTGIKALLLIVAVTYLAAMVCDPKINQRLSKLKAYVE